MKRTALTILLLFLFFALSASVRAAETPPPTIVQYPDLPDVSEPTIGGGIPQYIRYVFVFSLGTVGIVAFIAMLIAAFQYVTAVGNPQKAAAAKDRIASALLGMLLLFGSYLLLNTINPDLLKLKIAGEKVEISVPPEEPEGCNLKDAGWFPPSGNYSPIGKANVGDRVTFRLYWDRESCENKTITIKDAKLKLLQERTGAEAECEIFRESDFLKHPTEPYFELRYTFNDVCLPPVGIIVPACISRQTDICNYKEGQDEEFYIEGGGYVLITVTGEEGPKKQFIPKAVIYVKDNY